MTVHLVLEFISLLRSMDGLADFEKKLLLRFEEKFKSEDEFKVLDESQLEWLQQVFAERWKNIAWAPNRQPASSMQCEDYTFNQKGANAAWISLARQLEKELGKTYLEILMPTIKNKVEPNTFIRGEGADLSDLYIGDDGETWYSIKGLLNRVKMKQRFSTYNTVKYSPPRPLSLNELLKIRLKGQQEASFWNYFKLNILSNWCLKGAVPKQMLPSLLEILEIYFSPKEAIEKQALIKSKLTSWSKSLCECPIDDVNCLYGQTIKVGANKLFLIDILLDLLHEKNEDITDKLLGVVKWLFNYDGSYILYREALRDLMTSAIEGTITLEEALQTGKDSYPFKLREIYKELKAGPWFDVSQLTHYFPSMLEGSPGRIKGKIVTLMGQSQEAHAIDLNLLGLISSLYDWRWAQIKGTKKDYTSDQVEANVKWIRLAQLLAGAGYIKSNYYRFLMPTIKYDIDPVQLDSITAYPLTYYLLSQDEHELILIRNCIDHFKVSGYFSNCNATPPMPLTKIEISRLQYADRRYRKFMNTATLARLDEEPISVNTVKAIYNLVDQSLFTIGLQFGQDYNELQSTSADKAYYTFYNFLHHLPEDERTRLNAQRILFNGKYVSFGQIMGKIRKGECIAVYGQYFVQLLVDYDPYKLFKPEIESNLPLKQMRANTRKKVYYEYQHINTEEAERRLKIMALSLLNADFQGHDVKEEVTFHHVSKQLTGVPKEILQTLIASIESTEVNHSRFVYSRVVETMVKPAYAAGKQSMPVHRWLMSIQDNSLFTKKDAWIKPTRLLQIISMPDFIVSPRMHSLFEQFYDECLQIYAQNHQNIVIELLINYKFGQLIQSLDETTRKELFLSIDKPHEETPVLSLLEANILHRLAVIGSEHLQSKEQLRFFGHEYYTTLKELLKNQLGSKSSSLQKIISNLNVAVASLDGSLCSDKVKSLMIKYLEKFSSESVQPIESHHVFIDSELISR